MMYGGISVATMVVWLSRVSGWHVESDPQHSFRYIERFRSMARDGADLVGEARLIDAMAPAAHAFWTQAVAPAAWAGFWQRRARRGGRRC